MLPPSGDDAGTGSINLGELQFAERPVGPVQIDPNELVKHVGIFATTGSGKTNTGFHITLQLLRHKIPFLIIDWKRSYRSLKSLERTPKFEVFTVGRNTRPFLWNPLRPPPKTHIRTWITILSEVLEKSHISGQGVADVLIEHIDNAFERRGFFSAETNSFPNFSDVRESVERVSYKGRRQLWQDSCLRILRSFTYGPAAAAFNNRNPIKLEEVLCQSTILELDQELPKSLRIFLSEVIFRWIHLYRLGQGEISSLRHVLILEEVHNLFPRSSIELQANNGLENIFREIRSFGQGMIAITQHPSLLPVFLLGNLHCLIFMSLTHEADIAAARQALFLERNQSHFLDLLRVGEGIVKIKGRVPAVHVRFPKIAVSAGSVTDADLMRK